MKGEPPELMRYMLLQAYRHIEHLDVSGAQFSQFVGQFKQQHDHLLAKVKDEIDPLLDDMSGNLSIERGVPLRLKLGEQVPLGTFMEKADAVGFGILGKVQASAQGEQLDNLVAGALSLMRVKGKVLFAYVYGNYETPKDLEWVRATSSTWVDQILMANRAQGPSTQTAAENSKASGFDWNRVIEKGIAGAIVGALLALILGSIQGLKRFFWKRKSGNHDA